MNNEKWYEKIFKQIRDKIGSILKLQKKQNTSDASSNKTDDFQIKEKSILSSVDATLAVARKKRETLNKILKHDEIYSDKSKLNVFKKRKKSRSFLLQTVLTCLKLLLVVIFMLGSGVLGGVIGLAEAYIETSPSLDIQKISDQDVNSYMYDSEGIEVTTFMGTQNREWARLDEMPDTLKNAVIAVEDVRFYYHNGVDLKRLLGAVANNFLNESVQGGSTLTQQLVKNRMLTTEQTYKRKIQEAYLAIQLEEEYTKEEILEAYINTNPIGGMNYGVKAAAKDYFNKELSQLTLRECAMLAGIPQSPYRFDPRRAYYVTGDTKPLNDRTDLVLKRMYQADYITKEQYDAALKEEVYIIEKSAAKSLYPYPYFIEYCINDIIDNLLFVRNLPSTKENRSAIENELRTSGYSIYMTLDTKVQTIVEETLSNSKYPQMANKSDEVSIEENPDGSVTETVQPQSAAVVYDHHTGEVKALVGGRFAPDVRKSFNRATGSKMPVGSSIKPIAVYGPAIDMGYSPASPVANIPVPITGWNTKTGYPATSKSTYGAVSLRTAIVKSLNISAARTLMDYVGIEQSKQYLLQLGIQESHIDTAPSGLALGDSGITPLEMAGAFGTIANEGTYLTPLSFTKVTDKNGKVILDANTVRERRQVFKPSTAYMLTDMLQDAVARGTGTKAQIAGMHVGGKTGTVQDNRGVFFAGITPYYTATVWVGSDKFKPLASSVSAASTSAPLWQEFMAKILKDMPDKPIIEIKPSNIQEGTVCSVSGMLVTEACSNDVGGHKPNNDMFLTGTVPTQHCTMHKELQICAVSGRAATPFCPESNINSIYIVLPDESSVYYKYPQINGSFSLYNFSQLTVIISEEDAYSDPSFASLFCADHNPSFGTPERREAVRLARIVIDRANSYLRDNQNQLSDAEKQAIQNAINNLTNALSDPMATAQTINQLSSALNNLVESPPEDIPEW